MYIYIDHQRAFFSFQNSLFFLGVMKVDQLDLIEFKLSGSGKRGMIIMS